MSQNIFTIGHQELTLEAFVGTLQDLGLEMVVDVRAHGRIPPDSPFAHHVLPEHLRAAGIRYQDVGRECTDPVSRGSRPGYARYARSQQFQAGLERIRVYGKAFPSVLLGTAMDPIDCPRGLLLGRHLQALGLSVIHILHKEILEPQPRMAQRLCMSYGLTRTDACHNRADLENLAFTLQEESLALDRGSGAEWQNTVPESGTILPLRKVAIPATKWTFA